MNDRILTPYEQTQLAKYGLSNQTVTNAIPIEYLTGKVTFCGLEFSVNQSVLIPRVETEGLVELALQVIAELLDRARSGEKLQLLEVGTGSGAVMICLDQHLAEAKIEYQLTATDISAEALAVAQNNAQWLSKKQPLLIKNDLLTGLTGQYHLIVANLPYIPSNQINQLDEGVKNFEPRLALDGGVDGFSMIKLLVDQAVSHLLPEGTILLEVDQTHDQQFFNQFSDQFSIADFKDCFDRHRFVRLDLKK